MRVFTSAVVAAFLVTSPLSASSEVLGPALTTPESTLRAALHCPDTFDGAHEPVLLVHGTFVNGDINWSWSYEPALAALGLDVCTVDLPNNGLDDMQISTEYVVFAVREIAARSGKRVDTLGSSQGGLEPRWAIKWWPDVQATVDDHVMVATPNHGVQGRPPPGVGCFPSCWQMARGSNFLAALNSGDETPGDVSYTSVYTLFDVLVSPIADDTSALEGGTNILLQDVCPLRPVDHALINADAVTFALAVDAFTHPGPTDLTRIDPAVCTQTSIGSAYENGLQAVVDEIASGGAQWSYVAEEPPLKPYANP